eukprot:TRINITY_DN293_c0_g1_i2.p1 TRINITY_DN293_c0_g1~~TRINITY_DN293_c0_g1_i2.p1  ORF type:complete len:124 (+),score=15.82 TRINITY_DN293_c0_g1_i2:224-595(+)
MRREGESSEFPFFFSSSSFFDSHAVFLSSIFFCQDPPVAHCHPVDTRAVHIPMLCVALIRHTAVQMVSESDKNEREKEKCVYFKALKGNPLLSGFTCDPNSGQCNSSDKMMPFGSKFNAEPLE